MNRAYFKIKDHCRKGLLKHFFSILSGMPDFKKPFILDAGCGSGVPAMALAEYFDGNIIAVDDDDKPLKWLEEKVIDHGLSGRIAIVNSSLFDMDLQKNHFDIIVAEGLLNVVGFEKGFLKLIPFLKKNGYLIVHDEVRNHLKKIEWIEQNHCSLIKTLGLDEHVWWNDYYQCLEKEISAVVDDEVLELFKTDLKEIELFKQDSSPFVSMYYVIEKNS